MILQTQLLPPYATTAKATTPEYVERWVNQFDAAVQLPILREMDHVLKQTYYSKETVQNFLSGLFNTTKLVGDDPSAFWKSVSFLDIQGGAAQVRKRC